MTRPHGVPPGRAGRTWLLGRLRTAQRGVELLEGKLRVLQREQQRYRLQAERTGADWERASGLAAEWLLRAALLGGQRTLAAASSGPAEIEVAWTVSMGARHPREATVHGGVPAGGPVVGTAALAPAAAAHRAALVAAARHAVASEAARRIDAEVGATRRRLRALEDRWLPRLTAELAAVDAALEEQELADAGRLRWATARSARAGGGAR